MAITGSAATKPEEAASDTESTLLIMDDRFYKQKPLTVIWNKSEVTVLFRLDFVSEAGNRMS